MRLLLTWLAVLSVSCTASAQLPPVTQAPPPIQFPPLKQIGETSAATEYEVRFPSSITTEYPQNNEIPVQVFLPKGAEKPVPVVLVLHYWGAIDQRVETALANELAKRGVAAALMALPYHLGRTPTGYRSGELAIQPDPPHLVSTMTQSVMDARRTLDFLSQIPELDHSKIGIAGTSLGAIVATVVYGVDPRVSKACFMLGGVDLAGILWNSSRVVTEREELRKKGYTQPRMREELASVEPLNFLRAEPSEDAFVIGARYDTVVPAFATEKLIDALGKPKVLWLETGHYGGFFVQQKLLSTAAQYFATEFSGQSYTPPGSLGAPTVRLGAQINSASGLDIGAGLDVYKFNRRGTAVATLFITPRGTQLFVGQRVDNFVSIGVSITPRRIAVGVMWSTVL